MKLGRVRRAALTHLLLLSEERTGGLDMFSESLWIIDDDVEIMSSLQLLSIQGRLKFLHGQSRQQNERSSPPQLALFAIATPLQPPAILEIRTKNMIFRTKHKLDFTPMACDAK